MMMLCALLMLGGSQPPRDEAVLRRIFRDQPVEAKLMINYLTGAGTRLDLQVQALRRANRTAPPAMKDGPSLGDVIIPADNDFFGDDLCRGSRRPGIHAYKVPSYVSLTYRRTIYDPGGEAWGDADLGVNGRSGVVYTGLVQRIWGHGFFIEIEIDPLNGVNQRVDLVHFKEENCNILPGLEIPCLKEKGLYTFSWSVRDQSYQVRKAKRRWSEVFQLGDFYVPAGYVMVNGTPCLELRALEGLDAGYAEGGNRYQVDLPHHRFRRTNSSKPAG